MVSEMSQSTFPQDLRYRFLQRTIAKEIYKCEAPVFIEKSMRSEINIIKEILSQPDKYNLSTPIAHVVSREPDFITYSDACLEAAGGFSKDLKFWWNVEWPPSIKSLTLKNLRVERRCKLSNKLVSINLLEFLTEIISYATVTVRFLQDETLCAQPYPILLNWTDNQTSQAWIKKTATRTPKGKALQRIICSLVINNTLGIKVDFIQGVNKRFS